MVDIPDPQPLQLLNDRRVGTEPRHGVGELHSGENLRIQLQNDHRGVLYKQLGEWNLRIQLRDDHRGVLHKQLGNGICGKAAVISNQQPPISGLVIEVWRGTGWVERMNSSVNGGHPSS